MATSPYKNVSFYGQGPLNQIQRDYAPSMQMAQQLMANGSNTAPVQSPLEGIARALQGGLGGYTNYATMKAMGDRQTALNTDMMAALGASKAQEFDRPTPDFVGPMQGSPGGTQGVIAELQKRNNPDALPFMMQLQNDQIQQEKAAEADKNELAVKNVKVYGAFDVAMKGVEDAFSKLKTDPVTGLFPAMTEEAQIADASTSLMAPALKSMFRDAGEGTFSEGDQKLLLNMAPKRTDHPSVVKWKTNQIREIVAAKLGQGAPATAAPGTIPPPPPGFK
jgi:hypothetical protein